MDLETILEEHVVGSVDTVIDGVSGVLYKLDRLLAPDVRRALSSEEGVQTYVIRCEYAPEIVYTGIFVSKERMQ